MGAYLREDPVDLARDPLVLIRFNDARAGDTDLRLIASDTDGKGTVISNKRIHIRRHNNSGRTADACVAREPMSSYGACILAVQVPFASGLRRA
jgi:hypothetical protein